MKFARMALAAALLASPIVAFSLTAANQTHAYAQVAETFPN